jgi:hypothetical protein
MDSGFLAIARPRNDAAKANIQNNGSASVLDQATGGYGTDVTGGF